MTKKIEKTEFDLGELVKYTFEGLDLEANGKAIAQIIPAIFDIIEHIFSDKATVSYVMAYVMEGGYLAGGMLDARLLDTETVQGLLDVLYAVLDTQVITDAILPLYQTFLGQNHTGENDLLSIYRLSAELVKEDIVSIVDALDYAVENKLMDYVQSFLYQYEVTVDYSTDMIANLVETVLSLNILEISSFSTPQPLSETVTIVDCSLSSIITSIFPLSLVCSHAFLITLPIASNNHDLSQRILLLPVMLNSFLLKIGLKSVIILLTISLTSQVAKSIV